MSSRQLFFVYALALPAFKVAMLPSYLASEVGRDMWISVGVAMIIDVVILACIVFIKTRVGVLEYSNGAVKIVSKVIAVLLGLYFLVQTVVLFEEIVAYLLQSFFDEADRIQIIVPLGVAIAYLAYKGERTLGRLAEIFVCLLLLTIVVSIAFNNANIDYSNLLPVMDTPLTSLAGVSKSALWFGDYLPLLFINVRDRKKIRLGYIFGGAIAIALSVTFVIATFWAQWGDLTADIPNAFARLSGYNFISADVGKVDWVTILTWITSCVIKLSLLMLGIRGAIDYVFGKNTSKITLPVSAFLVVGAIIFFVKDVKDAYTLGTSLWVVGVVMSVVPVIVYLLFSIFGKRSERIGKNIQE